ncbi:hypothetical protein [Pseudorhodoplanes sp.]|uniref:hypothetical protein n=1 Tax=Pseudorhodoplanes sp. TaxID=1934341 RepID=UPI00391A659C
MRWLPRAIPALIAIVAFDLAIVFGAEAIRIWTSPVYGLDQMVFANLVHGIGRLFGIKAHGLFSIAALFGALYLATAIVLMLHIGSRIAAFGGGRVSHELLDAGLILVVISTMVAATPAILQGATEFLVQQRLPLWLVGLAATLSMVERLPDADAYYPGIVDRLARRLDRRRHRVAARLVVTPALRNAAPARRWATLRGEAGMKVAAAPLVRPAGPWFTPH